MTYTITWYPDTDESKRAALQTAIDAIVPFAQKRSYKRSYSAARALAEQRGGRALAAPDHDEAPAAPWVARVYYTSAGDELLYFEAVLPATAAQNLASGRGQAFPIRERAHGRNAVRSGARLVTLPSQLQLTASVVLDDEDDAADYAIAA